MRYLFVLLLALLITSCGGPDKDEARLIGTWEREDGFVIVFEPDRTVPGMNAFWEVDGLEVTVFGDPDKQGTQTKSGSWEPFEMKGSLDEEGTTLTLQGRTYTPKDR